jgi:prepilin-type N-terminal cleavage/methylation domain-containing protein
MLSHLWQKKSIKKIQRQKSRHFYATFITQIEYGAKFASYLKTDLGRIMKKNNQNQVGFTLIETMITIAIISILTTMAIGRYQLFIIRSHVMTAMPAFKSLEIAIEEYTIAYGGLPSQNTDLQSFRGISITPEDHALGDIESITISNDGLLTAKFTASSDILPGALANKTFSRAPSFKNGVITWQTISGSLAQQYLP